VSAFIDWAIEENKFDGPNLFAKWRKDNARLFKHQYKRQTPEISFEEARERLQNISDPDIRRKGLELLCSGVRWSESFTFDPSTKTVVGKGAKPRRVYMPENKGSDYKGTYSKFLRGLRTVGLKPHLLRKLAATEFYNRGLNEFDLLQVMGWNSIETAKSYIAPKKEDEIEQLLDKIQKAG